ncbi:MAG: ArsR family transcriptional regulator [Flaviaesturariibacter sp.]|nr:ArsR family transcriptional regulator [Flaviaesturariibacter sp.]
MNELPPELPVKLEPDLKIDVLTLKKAALVLRAVNHKLRQQILKLIHQKGKITVTEIYVKLRLEQSVASQHLAILRKAGFVTTIRDGKFIYYSVSNDRLSQVHQFSQQLLK